MSNDTTVTVVAAILAVGLVLLLAHKIGKMAERRGRNYFTWAAVAVLVPIPAVVILLVLPNLAPPDVGSAARYF